jgi:hypothetical protein
MERSELEHLIRAASSIADENELIVIGSQSILGAFPDAPGVLKQSREADFILRNRPERTDMVEGSIGEESPFHNTFGYYAQGVDTTTAKLPIGWEGRLTKIQNENTRFAIGYCIDVHDLALSKLYANRPKDRVFVRELLVHNMVDPAVLTRRVDLMPIDDARKQLIRYAIERAVKTVAEEPAKQDDSAQPKPSKP